MVAVFVIVGTINEDMENWHKHVKAAKVWGGVGYVVQALHTICVMKI